MIMKKIETKYSNRAVFSVVGCLVVLLFTLFYTVEIYTKGCFIYSKTLESRIFDLFVCAFSFIPVLLMSIKVYRYFVKLTITDDVIQVKRPLKKSCLIDKKDVCFTAKQGVYSKYFPNRCFTVTDKKNPQNKIIVSEYYFRNYEEVRNGLWSDQIVS